MPVSKKRKKKTTKKKVNANNKTNSKAINRVPSQKGNWIMFKNTKTAHLEIVEGQEIEPGTLMKDSGFPNAKCFPEGSRIIKDMTPNCYDYVTSYGLDLCYNGGRILDNLSRRYNDEVDKVYAVYSPCEDEPPYKVFADIYVDGYDYHELCTIAQFWKEETLIRWLETPVGSSDIMQHTLELGEKTEPIDEDNAGSFLSPIARRGYRRIREMFEEKYPDNEKYTDEEVNALYEEFKFDMYFKDIRRMIEFNEKHDMPREFRLRDR